MNWIHALAAVLVTLPLAAHAETEWWSEPAATSEMTYSGGAQFGYLTLAAPDLGVTNVMNGDKVVQLSVGGTPPQFMGAGNALCISASVLGGLNFRFTGTAHKDTTVDGRLLGGVAFTYLSVPFFDSVLSIPLIGPAGGGELAVTQWLTPDMGLTVAAMAGVQLASFVMPIPMARATVGLTF